MRHTVIALAIASLTASASSASVHNGSLGAATALPTSWTGPYAGLSYGRTDATTTTTETITEVIPGEEMFICTIRCRPSGMYWPDTVVTSTLEVTTETQSDEAGVFAGFRFDAGTFVAGVEAASIGGVSSVAAQGGLDLGPVLVFASAGLGEFDGEDGNTYGVGADMRVGPSTLIGVTYTEGAFGDTDLTQTTLRVGWRF